MRGAPRRGLPVADAQFLRACSPELRRAWGLYFTPAPLVQAQVRLSDRLLRGRLGCPDGLGDEQVLIVDPACGGGAYPLAVLEQVGAARAGAVRQRMRLFEALPAAAALARARGLPVEERDVLASTVQLDAPVVVCLGNPPYRRGRRRPLASGELAELSAGGDGVHRKNLYNEYVYFWRWALRVALEQRAGPAIVCLVSAASYVRGPAFGGLRQRLRSALDELWVIDLEGDQRAARASSNVFPIRTPVAIALGARYGLMSTPAPARVHYTRLEGSAPEKLARLEQLADVSDLSWRTAGRGWGEPLLGRCCSGYARWPALSELFPWQLCGAQLKRTWPIGVTADVVRRRWQHLLALAPDDRRQAFGPTRDRDLGSAPPDLFGRPGRLPPLAELGAHAACPEPVRYAYRAFDRHWVLPDARLGDFMRPVLWRSCGPRQVFLTSLLSAVLGPGPAAIATALVPDLDHFRGSFGARGVIPLWCDAAATRPNVAPGWLQRLSEQYGGAVSPLDLLGYAYALLSAPSYTRRFAEELRTPGPRLPLTADASLFCRVAAVGTDLVALHTYQRVAPGRARVVRPFGGASPERFTYADGLLTLGEGQVGPVPAEVWAYSVSGYRVLGSWVRRRLPRTGRSPLDAIAAERWTDELTTELLQLVWLLEATLARAPALDGLLEEVVSRPTLRGY